jgi:hypothetical protein
VRLPAPQHKPALPYPMAPDAKGRAA